MTIGKTIAFMRKQKGWTQGDFAEIMGMSPSAIQRVETGKSDPPLSLLQRIAYELSCYIVFIPQPTPYDRTNNTGIATYRSKKQYVSGRNSILGDHTVDTE
jgi:XRE family transcriptional regulator, fatty acid utilization regulator